MRRVVPREVTTRRAIAKSLSQYPSIRVRLPVGRRTILWLVMVAFLIVLLVDGGSVAIVRAAAPDDARQAGYAAAEAVAGLPNTQKSVVLGYEAATRNGTAAALHIERKGFTVYPDGKVTLTVSRTAPTLVFKHLPVLRDLTVVTATTTVAALPYS